MATGRRGKNISVSSVSIIRWPLGGEVRIYISKQCGQYRVATGRRGKNISVSSVASIGWPRQER